MKLTVQGHFRHALGDLDCSHNVVQRCAYVIAVIDRVRNMVAQTAHVCDIKGQIRDPGDLDRPEKNIPLGEPFPSTLSRGWLL